MSDDLREQIDSIDRGMQLGFNHAHMIRVVRQIIATLNDLTDRLEKLETRKRNDGRRDQGLAGQ